MQIIVNIPDDLVQRLDQSAESLARQLLEVVVAHAYRTGKIGCGGGILLDNCCPGQKNGRSPRSNSFRKPQSSFHKQRNSYPRQSSSCSRQNSGHNG
jgi:hypothetical protein